MAVSDMEKACLLIVDDDPMLLKTSALLLSRKFKVITALDGKQAIDLVRSEKPDLVLLDVMMPRMDGFEVCSRLKADPTTAAPPVIFVSTLIHPADKVRAFESGAVDYITKPFHYEEIVARIDNHLRMFRMQRELERNKRDLERENRDLARKNEELRRAQEALLASQEMMRAVLAASKELSPGDVLDEKYRLDEKIGTGGFGAVYRATDLNLFRPVAIKILRPQVGDTNAQELERLRIEGISACRINHQNAVTVLDFGVSASGIAYLVMELLEGHLLHDEMRRKGKLSLKRAVEVLIPVCEVLAQAHGIGIVHRDVKPENIYLHYVKDGEIVKVIDFGIAKLFGEISGGAGQNLTLAGNVVGTPVYMAPERLQGHAYDGRSDVYSLGVMLYQMLAGTVPFQGRDGDVCEIAIKHLTEAPPSIRAVNSAVPEAVERAILRALTKDPEQRPTAREWALELTEAFEYRWSVKIPLRAEVPKSTPGSLPTIRFNASAEQELTLSDTPAGGTPR